MDWKKITQELIASGLTQVEIAKRVGCSQPTIAMLAAGQQQDLRWTYGDRLQKLHRRQMSKAFRGKAVAGTEVETDQCNALANSLS